MMNWTTAQSAEIATIAACIIAAISILGLALAALWNARIRNADLRQREFENYHKILDTLSSGTIRDGDGAPRGIKLTSQAALVHELKFYTDRSGLTRRMLNLLREQWTRNEKNQEIVDTLTEEIRLTISYLDQQRSRWRVIFFRHPANKGHK